MAGGLQPQGLVGQSADQGSANMEEEEKNVLQSSIQKNSKERGELGEKVTI